jgi:hypothetical protein
MSLPAASDGVSATKSAKGLRGKPRGMHPSQFISVGKIIVCLTSFKNK